MGTSRATRSLCLFELLHEFAILLLEQRHALHVLILHQGQLLGHIRELLVQLQHLFRVVVCTATSILRSVFVVLGRCLSL